MIQVRMHLTIPPSEARWAALMALAEVTANNNAYWYGAELDQGVVPPCCLACAQPKVRYAAPPPGRQQDCQNFWSAPQVLARGKGNCIDASAYDVGAARADGSDPGAYVYLEPVGTPIVPGDPYSTLDFHAWAVINGVAVDSSAKLNQAAGCDCG